MKTRVNIAGTLDEFHTSAQSVKMDDRLRRTVDGILQRAGEQSVQSIIIDLMDEPYYDGRYLRRTVDERRSGRILAWRQGKGSPSDEQQLCLRLLWLCAQLDPHFGNTISVAYVPRISRFSRPGRSHWNTWSVEDLIRQRRYDELAELVAHRMQEHLRQ